MGLVRASDKPHAVCIPYPSQGHVNPSLQGPNYLDGIPDFRFESIPDGLPPSDADFIQDMTSLCDSISKNCLAPFWDLISKLNDPSSSSGPPVTRIVADGVMSFTLDAAEKFGVPEVLFWTTSAYESCLSNGYLDTVVDFVPGKKKTIRLRDFPTFLRTTDLNDIMLDFFQYTFECSCFLLCFPYNSVYLHTTTLPPVYTIDPLQHLVHQISNDKLTNLGSSLWKEQPECLQWLDSKEPNSVVYVNFGSMIVLAPQHLTELAWGLANSNKAFLWIIRPDLFITETRDRGMLASWCPQVQVLKHPAVGGFVTHCGWNSTSESICGGVPLICMPFRSEQLTNCCYSCSEWGIGMEIDNNVKRVEVEKLVRELMDGEKGKEMKKKVMEWRKLAEEAIMPGGSSYNNFNKLLSDVLLSKK
ncbi:hypothetical protein AAG906_039260 [Vitis piasezkii]